MRRRHPIFVSERKTFLIQMKKFDFNTQIRRNLGELFQNYLVKLEKISLQQIDSTRRQYVSNIFSGENAYSAIVRREHMFWS